MQRASPLNSGRDRATLSRPCCPLLHPASARAVPISRRASSLVFFLASPPSAYLLPFLRGFCPRWKGNHGALRVTGPVVFFSSREDRSLHLHHPDCRFLISFPSPFSSFFLRAFHSCQAQALVVRLRPPPFFFFFFCDL